MLGSMGRAQTVFISKESEGKGLERDMSEGGFEGTCFSCWLKAKNHFDFTVPPAVALLV